MGTMRDAVDTALSSTQLPPRAAPHAELVRRYADLVDEDGDVVKLGPRIMSTLRELGLSPSADGPAPPGEDEELDDDERELERLADAARQQRTAARHAAVTATHP